MLLVLGEKSVTECFAEYLGDELPLERSFLLPLELSAGFKISPLDDNFMRALLGLISQSEIDRVSFEKLREEEIPPVPVFSIPGFVSFRE
jgi:hypothetical protein